MCLPLRLSLDLPDSKAERDLVQDLHDAVGLGIEQVRKSLRRTDAFAKNGATLLEEPTIGEYATLRNVPRFARR